MRSGSGSFSQLVERMSRVEEVVLVGSVSAVAVILVAVCWWSIHRGMRP